MNKLRAMLIEHEGLRLKPYRDSVGKITIGVGRNLDNVGISVAEAMLLLSNDIDHATQEASEYSWFKSLSTNRQDVVICMIFNLGRDGFDKFQKMIKAMINGSFDKAADEMLDSKWAEQVGKRAYDLAQMMRNG